MTNKKLCKCGDKLAKQMTKKMVDLFNKDCVFHDVENLLNIFSLACKATMQEMGYDIKTLQMIAAFFHGETGYLTRAAALDYPREIHTDILLQQLREAIVQLENPDECLHARKP